MPDGEAGGVGGLGGVIGVVDVGVEVLMGGGGLEIGIRKFYRLLKFEKKMKISPPKP